MKERALIPVEVDMENMTTDQQIRYMLVLCSGHLADKALQKALNSEPSPENSAEVAEALELFHIRLAENQLFGAVDVRHPRLAEKGEA